MIAGGWAYIWAAYAATFGAVSVLALIVVLRMRHWAHAARKLDQTNAAQS